MRHYNWYVLQYNLFRQSRPRESAEYYRVQKDSVNRFGKGRSTNNKKISRLNKTTNRGKMIEYLCSDACMNSETFSLKYLWQLSLYYFESVPLRNKTR